jgi:hypothetical protein
MAARNIKHLVWYDNGMAIGKGEGFAWPHQAQPRSIKALAGIIDSKIPSRAALSISGRPIFVWLWTSASAEYTCSPAPPWMLATG